MPKQPPAPKRAPAVPLGGTTGTAFPPVPTLPAKARTGAKTAARDQAREDRITHYWFYAFMVLDVLGLAAVGYAIMTM